MTSNERRAIGDVCIPVRSSLIIIGVDITYFSGSDPESIFDNLDLRLTGDSRKAKNNKQLFKFYSFVTFMKHWKHIKKRIHMP